MSASGWKAAEVESPGEKNGERQRESNKQKKKGEDASTRKGNGVTYSQKRTVLLLFLRVCNGLAIVIKVAKAFETCENLLKISSF